MITLALEASTYEGSAALLDGSRLLGERLVAMRGREHEALMDCVGELLAGCELSPSSLERVVCGAGPGSFTSLRIAGSIAKGLALSTGASLIPVSSLTLMAAFVDHAAYPRVLACLDAMRGEAYVQLHAVGVDGVSALGPVGLLPISALRSAADEAEAVSIGPVGAEVHAVPRAAAAQYITKMIDGAQAADLAGWEPGYGRLAEAQVKWEAVHGRPLPA